MSTIAPAPAKQTDVEILELLDFKPETPCGWNRLEADESTHCNEPAKWAFVCRTCAMTEVVCPGHHWQAVREATNRWHCAACLTTAVGLFNVFHVIPFGRS